MSNLHEQAELHPLEDNSALVLRVEDCGKVLLLIRGTHVIQDVEGCEETSNIVSEEPDFRERTLSLASL